tara:strand:- start:333 stop:527 length:195 start_codon:yes stop_codon:yes gene_type:complete
VGILAGRYSNRDGIMAIKRKIKIKDDRGPLDLTRRIEDLEKENIKLKKKLKEERRQNKEMLNYP